MEGVYRSRARITSLLPEQAVELEADYEVSLTALYTQILEFHARALCYLWKHGVTKVFNDMFKCDGWDDLRQEISSSESRCRSIVELIDGEKLHRGLEEQEKQLRKLERATTDILNGLLDSKAREEASAQEEKLTEESTDSICSAPLICIIILEKEVTNSPVSRAPKGLVNHASC